MGADSTIRFLGRGSACINTGGEKVHPEEVEAALKRQEAISDAAVVGLPDQRFGEVVVALVEPRSGADIDLAGLDAVLRTTLAGYKVPRRVLVVETIGPSSRTESSTTRRSAAGRRSCSGPRRPGPVDCRR